MCMCVCACVCVISFSPSIFHTLPFPTLISCPPPPQAYSKVDKQLLDLKTSNFSLEKQVAELGAQATSLQKGLAAKSKECELFQMVATNSKAELKATREELMSLQMEVPAFNPPETPPITHAPSPTPSPTPSHPPAIREQSLVIRSVLSC